MLIADSIQGAEWGQSLHCDSEERGPGEDLVEFSGKSCPYGSTGEHTMRAAGLGRQLLEQQGSFPP